MAKQERTDANAVEAEVSEAVYPIAELAANSQAIFSVNREVLLAAVDGDEKSEFTITEAKQKIKTFLKKEVE